MSNINELVLEMLTAISSSQPVVNLMRRESKMQPPGQQGNWLNFQTKPNSAEPYTKDSDIRFRALNGRIQNKQFIPTSADETKKPFQVNWGLANQMGNWKSKPPELNTQPINPQPKTIPQEQHPRLLRWFYGR